MGLKRYTTERVDSIVIAGMGGELVIHGLTAGETVCWSAKELILQPQSEVSKVREYVRNTGYKIVDEGYDFGGRKILIRCSRCGAVCGQFRMDNMDKTTVTVCDLYWTCTLSKTVIRCFGSSLSGEHHKLAANVQQLRTQEMSDSIMDRIEQINEMMAYNEAYPTMGQ